MTPMPGMIDADMMQVWAKTLRIPISSHLIGR